MLKETIKQYTILYQYLLLLKEPTYIFLIQILQHLSPEHWWENYIEPVMQRENKENFKYLDMSDLLNVLKMNWDVIFKYRDKEYMRFKYDKEYRLVNKVHYIRTIVAHANEIDMSPFIFAKSLSYLLEYSKLINANENLCLMLEQDWTKHSRNIPENFEWTNSDEILKEKIIDVIEKKVLLEAKSSDKLPPDIKLSIDRTTMRIHSMRTVEEIVGFFNNAIHSERGIIVQNALHKENLLAFEDVKEEINKIYLEK